MHCEEALELISARMDGELAEETQRPLEEHLAHCAACRAAERDFLLLRDALEGAVEIAPPPELKQTVMANLPSRKKPKAILPLHWKRWGASAAAVVLVALAAWSLPDHIAVPDAASEEEYAVESYSDAPADLPADTGSLAPASAEGSGKAAYDGEESAPLTTEKTDAETPVSHTTIPRAATQAPAKNDAPAQGAQSTDTAKAETEGGGEAAMGLFSARTLPPDAAAARAVHVEIADEESSEAPSGAASDTSADASSDETEGERSEIPAGYAEDGLVGVNLEDRAVIHQEPVLYHAILTLSAPYTLEGAEGAVQESGDVWYFLPAEELGALVDALNAQEKAFALVDSGEGISSEEPYALVIVTAE